MPSRAGTMLSSGPGRAVFLGREGRMRRREFIALVGSGVSAWAIAARAQENAPLVGFLNSASPDTYRFNADSFRLPGFPGLAKPLATSARRLLGALAA